jgi:ferric-dicitrate binding protein FerR (iron transport regulator)
MQQLRLSPGSGLELNQLTDLYVDTSTARPQLYLVNGGQIITAELPNPPVPFTPANADETPAESAPPNLEAQGTTDQP